MNLEKLSPSINTSGTSSQLNSTEDSATHKAKNYVKELLKSRIFLGRYIERRLIDNRIGYRDVVLLSPAETEMKQDLLDAYSRLRNVYGNQHWIGISDSEHLGYNPPGICIWTEIDNQPFGPFWFQVKGIKFRDLEVTITLKCLRYINDTFLELEPILTGALKPGTKVNTNKICNTQTLNETYQDFLDTLKTALSISNVKEFFTFIFALIIAIFTGSTALIEFLGNFILALVRETSIFIKNSTPLFLGFLDFLSKIVGGFYILLAMIFRTSTQPLPKTRSITQHEQKHNYDDFDSRYID